MQGIPIGPHYQLLPTRHGSMLVNRNDLYMGQSYLHYGECCQFETETLLQLLAQPSASYGLVVEVGANMGVHTVPIAACLAQQNRPLLALEPQPAVFQQLCANLALNGLMNVTALPFASAAQSGVLAFELPNYAEPGNFGGTVFSAKPAVRTSRTQTVPCYPLDELLRAHFPGQPVTLIKIDTEGCEFSVLQGGEQTLRQHHPILYLENDRFERSESLIRFLFAHEYRLWWHISSAFNPDNHLRNPENVYPNIVFPNMIALHPDHKIVLQGLDEVIDPTHHPLAKALSQAS